MAASRPPGGEAVDGEGIKFSNSAGGGWRLRGNWSRLAKLLIGGTAARLAVSGK
jgi:hypothetical protein